MSFAILLAIFLFCFYFFLNHKQEQDIQPIDNAYLNKQISKKQEAEKYSNINDKYFGKDIVLFAHFDVEIKITETISGKETIHNLKDGDVLFLNATDNLFITSDAADKIEVLLDNGSNQESIGNLDDVLLKY